MLSYGTNIIIWGKCYHVEWNITWNLCSCGRKGYHVEDFIIKWEEILSYETNIMMASKYSIIM